MYRNGYVDCDEFYIDKTCRCIERRVEEPMTGKNRDEYQSL